MQVCSSLDQRQFQSVTATNRKPQRSEIARHYEHEFEHGACSAVTTGLRRAPSTGWSRCLVNRLPTQRRTREPVHEWCSFRLFFSYRRCKKKGKQKNNNRNESRNTGQSEDNSKTKEGNPKTQSKPREHETKGTRNKNKRGGLEVRSEQQIERWS